MNRRRTRVAAATLGILALVGAGTVAHAAEQDPPTGGVVTDNVARDGSELHTFTLVTGDTATAQTDASGALISAGLRGAGGEELVSTTLQTETGLYVFPAGTQELVDAGVLDAELFNLQTLLDSGYDDARTDSLPVILDYADGATARSSRAVPGVELGLSLDSIGATGASIDKSQAAAAWQGLRGSAAARSANPVETIWLDRKLHASDLESPTVPLTGAPAAHDAGFDGEGVTVAVLDTGYDTAHVDLQEQVVGTASFVWGGAVQDLNGHGTHVASTIAGTGAASDGTYAGVAPGADLLVGKVLDDDGSGYASSIIAGMQWAVGAGADIVSMSLGATGTACAGPEVEAVRALSDEALFVIAAGNSGLAGSISTPGCAAEALTVGALDRENATASFSSRGPIFGGSASKPDLASQGVRVVAARAGGEGELAYQAMSGTSMATPHVAGGAALVLDAMPELTPAQLKDVLTSSASASDTPVFDQGAGPMDLARAVSQHLTAPANTSLGDFAYPQGAPAAAKVTVTNSSDTELELSLALEDLLGGDRETVPAKGLVTLDATTITVPAGGSADIPLTVAPSTPLDLDATGTVTGRLVGTSESGERVIAPFSVWIEPASYTVTVKAVDRFGNPASSPSSWAILDSRRATAKGYALSNGASSIRVRAGTYTFTSSIMTRDEPTNRGPVESVAVLAEQEVVVDGPTVIEFDAREAERLTWKTDEPSKPLGYSVGIAYTLGAGVKAANLSTAPNYVEDIYGHSEGEDPAFSFVATTRAYAPPTEFSTAGGPLDAMQASLNSGLAKPGSAKIVASTAADADLDGAFVLLPVKNVSTLVQQTNALAAKGAVGVIVTAPGTVGRLPLNGQSVKLPLYSVIAEVGDRLAAEIAAEGAVDLAWTGTAVDASPYAYNLTHLSTGRIETGEIVVPNGKLAKEKAVYHSQGDTRKVYTDLMYTIPRLAATYASGSTHWVTAPLERTDYFSTDSTFAWTNMVMPNYVNAGALFDGPRVREPGLTRTTWGEVPSGAASSTAGTAVLTRDSNRISLSVPFFGDAAGHDAYGAYGDGRSTLFRVNGTPVVPSSGEYTMPQERAELELTTEWVRPVSAGPVAWNTGISYRTVWSLTTEASMQGRQHALIPVVDVPVDGANRVGTDSTKITVEALDDATREAAELAEAKVWYAVGDQARVSQIADDTWQAVKVRSTGDGITTVLPAQASGSFVHLKVELTAADGSKVVQTMVRAYGVR